MRNCSSSNFPVNFLMKVGLLRWKRPEEMCNFGHFREGTIIKSIFFNKHTGSHCIVHYCSEDKTISLQDILERSIKIKLKTALCPYLKKYRDLAETTTCATTKTRHRESPPLKDQLTPNLSNRKLARSTWLSVSFCAKLGLELVRYS